MKKVTLTFWSITYAIKVRKLLLGIGIKSKLIKIDSRLTNEGCVYGVEIEERYLLDAVAELKRREIKYSLRQGDT